MRIRMEIFADVEVTEEIKQGLKEDRGWSDADLADDEQVARAIMFASLNPRLYGWIGENELQDDWFDGVGNLKGLISNVNLDDDPF